MSEHEKSIERTRELAIQFGFPVYAERTPHPRCECGAEGDHDECPLD